MDDEKYLTDRMNRVIRSKLKGAYKVSKPLKPRDMPKNRITSTRWTPIPVRPSDSIMIIDDQIWTLDDYQLDDDQISITIDDYQQASYGLSPARIAMFETFEVDESMNDEKCVICLLNFGEEDPITKVVDRSVMKLRLKENLNGFKQDKRNCKHVFHVKCITRWFRCKTFCPLCKKEKQ